MKKVEVWKAEKDCQGKIELGRGEVRLLLAIGELRRPTAYTDGHLNTAVMM